MIINVQLMAINVEKNYKREARVKKQKLQVAVKQALLQQCYGNVTAI